MSREELGRRSTFVRRAATTIAASLACASVLASAPVASGAAPAPSSRGPRFANYATPANLNQDAGEPSIGVDRQTGNVMFEAGPSTFRVHFDDSQHPATAAWLDKSSPVSVTTVDPILFTDPATSRTFVSQLAVACSLASYSDDDGQSWTGPTQGCGVGAPEDHQTVGAGPYHQPAPPGAGILYPNAVYYCHQDIASGAVLADGQAAYCALSLTGSVTFNNDVVIYHGLQCGGLHGHVKVAPDGTVYVPNQGCDQVGFDPSLPGEVYAHQAVAVSEDNGLTWQVRSIPDSRAVAYSDPSVAIGSGNTVYFGYQDGGNPDGTGRHPKIAVSHDHGVTWSPSVDVGIGLHIENVEFPMVTAGDDNRAAFGFLGTTTPGDDQAATFSATWHLYIAFTYDGGKTWSTIDATPGDPVQRGCVELVFPTSHCPHRNLLDFNDMTVDKQGRVVAAYADGCTAKCVTSTDPNDNKYTAVGTIARQTCGVGLFAAADGQLPPCIAAASNVTGSSPGTSTGRPLPASPLVLLMLTLGLLGLLIGRRRARN